MNYIYNCKRCGKALSEPVVDKITSEEAYMHEQCIEELMEEKKKKNLFLVPGLNEPYKI